MKRKIKEEQANKGVDFSDTNNLVDELIDAVKENEYVNSLVPANKDFVGAVMEQIKNSEYLPSYVKYHDGEKWVEVYSDSETVFTKGIKNNIPEEIERMNKENRFDPFVVLIWSLKTIIKEFIKKLEDERPTNKRGND